MEELESPNLDCVCIHAQFFSRNSSFHTVVNIVPGTIFLPIGLLIMGWAAQERVFWLVPDLVSDLKCTLSGGVLREVRRALY